jgi:hypothetical protein
MGTIKEQENVKVEVMHEMNTAANLEKDKIHTH